MPHSTPSTKTPPPIVAHLRELVRPGNDSIESMRRAVVAIADWIETEHLAEQEARRLLARLEWSGYDGHGGDGLCPVCLEGGHERTAHTPDCDLDRLALRDGAT